MFKRFQSGSNARVRNAQKALANDGTKCDSKLEKFCYDLFKEMGIPFLFQKRYELQPKFKFGDQLIRPITLTVDFWLPELNVIVDTKGFQTEVNALRWKMLKYHLKMDAAILRACPPPLEADLVLPEIMMPRNQKQVREVADLLKSRLM